MNKIVKEVQEQLNSQGYEAGAEDGLWGPQTETAYNLRAEDMKEKKVLSWRPDELVSTNPNNFPKQDGDSLNKYYGKVGENQTMITLPYTHRLAWDLDTTVTRMKCHEKVADSVVRALTKVFEHYGMQEIKRLRLNVFGGCLNVRKKRGGTTYSTHSWGIALDYDPSHNKLKWGRDRAAFAHSDYDFWWKCWEEEGWVSLGREKNFDWMHLQAAKL